MAAGAGNLEINLSTNIASVVQGFNALADIVGRSAKDITKQFDSFQGRIETITGSFRTLATVAIAGFSIKGIADLITNSIEAQAHLQDLADRVGSTASELSKLIPAARLSGTSLDEVGAASLKFSRNLNELQNGGGKAAATFKELGFNAADAARFLKNPTQGMYEISKALDRFQTDGNKSTAVMNLMGKGAAGMIPFLKQLAELGELQVRVTDEQAAAAKKLQDDWETVKLGGEDLRNSIAAGIVPALMRLLDVFNEVTASTGGFKQTVRDLAADGTLGIWLLNVVRGFAMVGEAIVAVVKVVNAFIDSVLAAVSNIKLIGAAMDYALGGFQDNSKLKKAFEEQQEANRKARADWKDTWEYNATAVSDSIAKQIRLMELGRTAMQNWASNADKFDRFLQGKQGLPGNAPTPKPSLTGGGDLDALNKQLEAFRKMAAEANIALEELLSGQKFTPAQRAFEALKATDAWKGFNAGAKLAIENAAKAAAKIQDQVELQTRFKAITDAYQADQLGYTKQYQEQLTTLYEKLKAGEISLKEYSAITAFLRSQQPFVQKELEALDKFNISIKSAIEAEKQFADAIQRRQDQVNQDIGGILKSNEELKKQNNLIFATDEERARGNVLIEYSAALENARSVGDEAGLRILQQQIAIRQALVVEQMRNNQALADQKAVLADITNATADFFKDFFENGSSAFKRLWDRFKQWALEALAKIAAQQIIVKLAGSFGLTQAATEGITSGNPLANLLGLGKGLGGLTGGGTSGIFGGGSGAGSLFGGGSGAGLFSNIGGALFGDTFGSFASLGVSPAFSALGIAATEGAASIGGFAAVAGAAAAALGPFVPLLALAIPLLAGLFEGEPAQTKGQFQVSAINAGFEDAISKQTKFGFIGFLDSATQQFSGEAAKVFDDLVSGALDAFAARMDSEGVDRLSSILQNLTFSAFEGEYTTEDFIKKYGGSVLQQVVSAAFSVLNPALQTVIDGFTGTADEVANFANTLLAINDLTEKFSEDFQKTIVSALVDAKQETADKVLAFVTIFGSFVGSLSELQPKLEALDPDQITAFVDALGGAQAALQSQTYIAKNFTPTSGPDVTARALADLKADFTDIGLQLPTTHQAFVDLLASFDLTTQEGRKLYASVSALAPAFIAFYGTADAAQQRVLQSADFFRENFFSDFEKGLDKAATATQALDVASMDLGVSIPRTIPGFRALIEGIDTSSTAGKALYNALLPLAPALLDVASAAGTTTEQVLDAAQFFRENFYTTAEQKANKAAEAIQKLDAAQAALGVTIPRSVEGFRDLINGIDTSTVAGKELYASLIILGPAVVDITGSAQDAVDALDDATDGITRLANGAVLLASGTVVDAATATFAELSGLFEKVGQGASGGTAGKLTAQLDLISDQIAQWSEDLAQQAARGFNETNSATYLSTKTILDKFKAQQSDLSSQLAQFVIWKAQYGDAIADQLLQLTNQYQEQLAQIPNNPLHAAALAALRDQFNARWQEIITGTSNGVDGTLDQLEKLRQGIRDYLDKLQVSNLSPLTPFQKFQEAQRQFNEQLGKAQGGDLAALGDITRFADQYLTLARDAFASSQTYTDIFAQVRASLEALAAPPAAPALPGDTSAATSASTSTTGTPSTPTDIASAQLALLQGSLPTGPISSSEDIAAVRDLISQLIETTAALGGVLDDNHQQAVRVTQRASETVVAAVRSRPK